MTACEEETLEKISFVEVEGRPEISLSQGAAELPGVHPHALVQHQRLPAHGLDGPRAEKGPEPIHGAAEGPAATGLVRLRPEDAEDGVPTVNATAGQVGEEGETLGLGGSALHARAVRGGQGHRSQGNEADHRTAVPPQNRGRPNRGGNPVSGGRVWVRPQGQARDLPPQL